VAGLRYSTFGFGGRMEVGDQGGEEGGWEEGREGRIQGRWPGCPHRRIRVQPRGQAFSFFFKERLNRIVRRKLGGDALELRCGVHAEGGFGQRVTRRKGRTVRLIAVAKKRRVPGSI